jgi:hypothetical protein
VSDKPACDRCGAGERIRCGGVLGIGDTPWSNQRSGPQRAGLKPFGVRLLLRRTLRNRKPRPSLLLVRLLTNSTCRFATVQLEMKITGRFRLVDHPFDQDTSRTICNPPVDGIAFLIAQDRGADVGEDR